MKFAAIYARSSLGKAKQGDTVEHQVDMIKEFSKRTNLKMMFDEGFIYEDDGESGFKTTLLQRPAMRRLLGDIDNGLIDCVFFKGVSRFTRDSGECITTVKRLINKGIRVISLEENYDSFRDDPTMFQIFAVLAENESRKTSIRVSLGNKQKSRNGLWSGSNTPYGYVKIKDIKDDELKDKLLSDGKKSHSLYPDQNAPIVRRIFEMFVNDQMGRKRITSWLNSNNYKTNKGRSFQEKTVLDILHNEVYIGNIVYGKTRYEYIESDESNKKIQKTIAIDENDWIRTENAHPPIITKELFIKTQELLDEKSGQFKHGKRFNAAKHPLTGLLKCGKCGSPMICQKRSNKRADGSMVEYRYYVCSTYHKMGRVMCSQANVNADKLEKEVLKITKNEITKHKDQWNPSNQTKTKNDGKGDIESEIKNMDLLIKRKINASKALLETREFYDTETFIQLNKEIQDEIKKVRIEKEELEKELDKLADRQVFVDIDKYAEKFLENEDYDLDGLRKIFHKLLREVTFKENEITGMKMAYLYS